MRRAASVVVLGCSLFWSGQDFADEPFECGIIGNPVLWSSLPNPSASKLLQSAERTRDLGEIRQLGWSMIPVGEVTAVGDVKLVEQAELDASLVVAAAGGDDRMASSLIAKGANVNAVPPRMDKWMPAIIWASACGHLSTVNLLIRHGADVNIRGETFTESGYARKQTALRWAQDLKHEKIVRLLLRHGAVRVDRVFGTDTNRR